MINVRVCEDLHGAVIHLHGFFDISSAYKVEKNWNKVMRLKPSEIAIDCRDLIFLDSSAIGILLKFMLQAKENSIQMTLLNMKPDIEELFIRNNLTHLFVFKNTLHYDHI